MGADARMTPWRFVAWWAGGVAATFTVGSFLADDWAEWGRVAGGGLELLGIAAVVWGLNEARVTYGGGTPISGHTLGGSKVSGTVSDLDVVDPTVERRLERLEHERPSKRNSAPNSAVLRPPSASLRRGTGTG